jgi:hypothetical protein
MKKILIILVGISIAYISGAQILYTNIEPDIISENPANNTTENVYNIDLDSDGTYDISRTCINYIIQSDYFTCSSNIEIAVDSYSYIATFNHGDTINQNLNFVNNDNLHLEWFAGNSNKYIAFRKRIGNDYYYGWIRIKNYDTITDCCINTKPNSQLCAGEGIVNTYDLSNFKDARDILIEFESIDEPIDSYRVFVVPGNIADNFDISIAINLQDNLYFEIVDVESSSYSFNLDSNTVDVNGEPIVEFVNYQIYLLPIYSNIPIEDNLLIRNQQDIVLTSPCNSVENLDFTTNYVGGTSYELNYNFNKAIDENGITEYRAYFVLDSLIDNFSIEDYLSFPESHYITFEIGSENHNGTFMSDTIIDIHGNYLSHLTGYKFIIFSVADSNVCNVHTYLISSTFNLNSPLPNKLYLTIAEDLNNSNNASDINISFNYENTNGVKEFRLFAKKTNDNSPLNVEQAILLNENQYLNIEVNESSYNFNLPENFVDIDGENISSDFGYRFYVLAVADSISKDISILSNQSNIIAISNPNYFKVGQVNGNGIFHTSLDTTLSAYSFPTPTYELDINNDGINDINFMCLEDHGLAYIYYSVQAIGVNNTRIAILDSEAPDTLHMGFPLCNHLNWKDTCDYLYYYYYLYSASTYKNIWHQIENAYLGVQLINGNDTIYAWIRIYVNAYELTIFEYAYQNQSYSINEIENINNLTIYPNPSSDYITIDFPNYSSDKKQSIKIYNTSGRHIKTHTLSSNKDIIQINDLGPGAYFIKTDEQNTYSKIIVTP